MKTGIETLLIDRINGKRLDHPIGIWVDNMDLPPAQFRCILKGYETVRMLGTPPAVEQAAREAGKDISLPQAGWKMQLYFVALSDVALKDVAIKSKPIAAIRSALPEGWTILKVEENSYPSDSPKGEGKAIFLVSTHSEAVDVIVFIMPADYQDGRKVSKPGQARTTNHAALIAKSPTAKVYLWERFGQFSAPRWPTMTDDILKALLK